MTQNVLGSARALLLAALALVAVVMVASIAVLTMQSTGQPRVPVLEDAGTPADEDQTAPPVPPFPGAGRARSASRAAKDGRDDVDDSDIVEYQSREPTGEEFTVTPASLRTVLAARHWEEIRRQIDALQDEGGVIPPDVVKQLLEMLAKEDLRLDAILALGQVRDDATGRALAELALSPDAALATRQAALDALAKSGQKASLPFLQQLVTAQGADPELTRHAVFSLARVGGPDATRVLLDLLVANAERGAPLHDAVVDALGKARDADAGIAAAARAAREKGDAQLLGAVLTAALIQGTASGPEVRNELARIVEGDAALSSFEEGEKRQIAQSMAFPAAAAVGLVDPVLRRATEGGILQDVALHALRSARGDDSAKRIAAALNRSSDDKVRRELTAALGETASRTATPTLVTLLDDPSENTRHAAARALGQIPDPAAVNSIHAHLGKAAPDHEFARLLVEALGRIGATESVATLERLVAGEEEFWRQNKLWINRAIVRIKTGNPDSQLLSVPPARPPRR